MLLTMLRLGPTWTEYLCITGNPCWSLELLEPKEISNWSFVIPKLTESYSSLKRSPRDNHSHLYSEEFSNAIEQTLQWARDLFEGKFTRAPLTARKPSRKRLLLFQEHSPLRYSRMWSSSFKERPENFQDCVAWARLT